MGKGTGVRGRYVEKTRANGGKSGCVNKGSCPEVALNVIQDGRVAGGKR